MSLESAFVSVLAGHFPHSFTSDQAETVSQMARFILQPQADEVFVLRGYAGTGKTSLVGALVRTLTDLHREVVLMAPTGRAAKVFSAYAGQKAMTIHKAIYRQQTFQGEGTRFSLGYNKRKHALFIVDEASMIAVGGSGMGTFGTGELLADLIRYVSEGEGCRLMFVGDTAQLPPVGEEESPALSADRLRLYGVRAMVASLTQVVRQTAGSDVLVEATRLREMITQGIDALPLVAASREGEVRYLPGNELIEALVSAYADCGTDGTIVVTRSNKRANIYNNGIRARIFDREDELTRGDLVMAVKNNYHWTELAHRPESDDAPYIGLFSFIANGDAAEVVRLRNVHEMYGFRFADATLRFADYDDEEIDCRVLLSTLSSESLSLTADEQQRLFDAVMADYADVPSKKERLKCVREDAYYNALQIKYAYAVTCHKAQGGQWERVFVDQGYVTPDMAGISYLRWLYTAMTRTTGRLYLVNWPEEQKRQAGEREA